MLTITKHWIERFNRNHLKIVEKRRNLHDDVVQEVEHRKILEGGTNSNRRHTLLEEIIGE